MKRNGFVFIESVIVLMVVALSLTMLISSYSLITRKTQEKEYYDRASDKYLLYSITNIGVNDECNYNLANSCGYEGINLQADEKNCNNTRVGKLLYNCSQTFKDMNIRHIYVVDDIKKELSQSNAVEKYDNGTIEYMKTLKKCNDTDSNTCNEPISYMIGVFYRSGNYYYASLKIDAIMEECEEGYYLSSITKKCERIEYVIKFDKQEGNGGTNSIKVSTGNKPGNISVPTKENYTFLGYYTEENGGGDQYYDSDGKALMVFNQSQNITLYAHWTETRLAGLGTEEDPYKIQFIEDLVDLSNNVNKEGNTYGGKYFILTKNLDFQSPSSYKNSERTDYGDINGINGNETLIKELTTGSGFEPIGVNSPYFQGIFDGKNFKILNLYINNTNKYDNQNIGLFGRIENSKISNLTISGSIETMQRASIGGIVGYIKNTTIENCHNSVNIISNVSSSSVGGIVGGAHVGTNIILDSTNNSSISGSNNAAGIIGYNDSKLTIERCTNNGTITNNLGENLGGILGRDNAETNETNIIDSNNTGQLKINSTKTSGNINIGGLVGKISGTLNIQNSNNENSNNIMELTYKGDVWSYMGGLIGMGDGAKISIDNATNNQKLKLTNNSSKDLKIGGIMSYIRNSGNFETNNVQNLGDMEIYDNSNAIPYIGGIIGLINTSSTLIINKSKNSCEKIQFNGKQNDKVIAIGGLVGEIDSATAKISDSYNTSNIYGGTKIAGIIAYNFKNSKALINKCYNSGNFETSNDADGSSLNIGGLIAYNAYGSTCYILNSYNIGNLKNIHDTADVFMGGLIGDVFSDTRYSEVGANSYILNSYNLGNVENINGTSNIFVNGIINTHISPLEDKLYINNAYNVGNLTGNIRYGFGNISSKANYIIQNAYYKNDIIKNGTNLADDSTITIGKSESEIKNQTFVNTLNTNKNNINLSSIDSALSGYTLCNWKLGTSGYPELSC